LLRLGINKSICLMNIIYNTDGSRCCNAFVESRWQCNGHVVHVVISRGSEPDGYLVVSSNDSHCRLCVVGTHQVSHVSRTC